MVRLSEYLELRPSGICCVKCNRKLGSRLSDWKSLAKVAEVPLRKAGPLMSNTRRFILREFYCPGCATLLEVEMTRKNEPFLFDEIS